MTRSMLSLAFIAVFACSCSGKSSDDPAPQTDGTKKVAKAATTKESPKPGTLNNAVRALDDAGTEDSVESGGTEGESGAESEPAAGGDSAVGGASSAGGESAAGGELPSDPTLAESDGTKLTFEKEIFGRWDFVHEICTSEATLLPLALSTANEDAQTGARTHAYVFSDKASGNHRLIFGEKVLSEKREMQAQVSNMVNGEKFAVANLEIRFKGGNGTFTIVEGIYGAKLSSDSDLRLELTRIDAASGCPNGLVTAVYARRDH